MTDEAASRLERRLGGLLLTGLIAATVCLAAGLALTAAGAAAAAARTLLTSGFLILMGTPILRVVVSVAEYVRARDWFFVSTTLAVLAVLLATIVAALFEI